VIICNARETRTLGPKVYNRF